MSDGRYPYTYADDFIRSIPNITANGTKLSRSEASQIISKIAEIIGIDRVKIAEKLADYYMANPNEYDHMDEFMRLILEKNGK